MRRTAAGLVVAIGILLRPHPSVSQTTLPPIIQRASQYVTAFVARFSNMVAEERYVQSTERPEKHRELRSDFLLVRPPGQEQWFQFRDVLEVDGRSVGGRDKRMEELFVDPPADLLQRIAAVTSEGARYNLEDIGTLDRPLIALSFLQAQYVDRFAFVTGRLDNELGPNVRLVQFREIGRPTILRGGIGDLPSSGKYWIEEDSGRVVKTELDFRADRVETTFRFDPELQTDVPVEMTQQWRLGRTGVTVFKATATYGRFRRFKVQTEETIGR